MSDYQKVYQEANKEKIAAYYATNKEKIVAQQKVYGEANKEKSIAYQKAYYKNKKTNNKQ